MKMYQIQRDGRMYVTDDAPDGYMIMELLAKSVVGREKELVFPPIVQIDYNNKTYRREGWGKPQPWPDHVWVPRLSTWNLHDE